MRMHLVEIAHAREEAAELAREAVGQRGGANERFLHFDLVVARDGGRQLARKVRIDAGGERELGLAQIEAALSGTDLIATRRKAGNVPICGVARRAGVAAAEN